MRMQEGKAWTAGLSLLVCIPHPPLPLEKKTHWTLKSGGKLRNSVEVAISALFSKGSHYEILSVKGTNSHYANLRGRWLQIAIRLCFRTAWKSQALDIWELKRPARNNKPTVKGLDGNAWRRVKMTFGCLLQTWPCSVAAATGACSVRTLI